MKLLYANLNTNNDLRDQELGTFITVSSVLLKDKVTTVRKSVIADDYEGMSKIQQYCVNRGATKQHSTCNTVAKRTTTSRSSVPIQDS